MSVADLLGRHGQVLAERGAPPPVPVPRRPLSGRLRRTLVAVGSVLAAGSVLGGAVAVTTTGHDTPLGRPPGGLSDQLGPGPAESRGAPVGPAVGIERPAAVDAPAGRVGPTTATRTIPAPRAATEPVPAPSASTAPTIVVVPRTGGAGDDSTTARSGPGPTGRVSAPPAQVSAPTGGAVDAVSGTAAQPGTTAPTDPAGGAGPVTGLLGGVGKTVGGLLGS